MASRDDKKLVSAWVSNSAHTALKTLAAQRGLGIQDLVQAALDQYLSQTDPFAGARKLGSIGTRRPPLHSATQVAKRAP